MRPVYFLLALLALSCTQSDEATSDFSRTQDFNLSWKFLLTDSLGFADDFISDGNDKTNWQSVRLPHDWVIGNPYDSTLTFAEGTGYIAAKGIGWYSKIFDIEKDVDSNFYIHFDGVYNNSTVWINGNELGFHPYGYSPFYYNLTPYLTVDGKNNEILIRVNRLSYADSRWYTGAGIYRNVELVKTSKLHIPIWGTFITTPSVSNEKAVVNAEIKVENDFSTDRSFTLNTAIYDPHNNKIATISSSEKVNANSSKTVTHATLVENPKLWDLDTPHLYKAVTKINLEGKTIDQYETIFGIRSIKFDANSGFWLNGKDIKIKGVCLHHDAGLVGTAVPKDVWRRRLQTLKDGGTNAIRSAHNPASSEFLDLCDEMGLLVQDEFYDEWDYPKDKRFNMKEKEAHPETEGHHRYFQEWAQPDLETTVLSHRNHPSIIQWSIGNEIEWTYERAKLATGFFNNINWSGGYFFSRSPFSKEQVRRALDSLPKAEHTIGETAQKLADWTRALDTTRTVTANCILPTSSHESGYGAALDVVGYSYRRVIYDYGHENYPDKPLIGNENVAQWQEWKAVSERPFVAGMFIWTGAQYLGEIRGDWPLKGSDCGMLDFASFPRPSYDMFRGLWLDTPSIAIYTNTVEDIKYRGKPIYKIVNKQIQEIKPGRWEKALWSWHDVNKHWNYQAGQDVVVELYSNCDEIELFLNDRSLGKKHLSDFDDKIYKWLVSYAAGTITAKGSKDGMTIVSKVSTSTEPADLEIRLDKTNLRANNYDVAHIEVQLLDSIGQPVFHSESKLTFEFENNLVRNLGVDNGDMYNVQPHSSTNIVTSQGRAVMIVQANDTPGTARIKIYRDGEFEQEIALDIHK